MRDLWAASGIEIYAVEQGSEIESVQEMLKLGVFPSLLDLLAGRTVLRAPDLNERVQDASCRVRCVVRGQLGPRRGDEVVDPGDEAVGPE